MVLERGLGPTQHPQAHFINNRTMEVRGRGGQQGQGHGRGCCSGGGGAGTEYESSTGVAAAVTAARNAAVTTREGCIALMCQVPWGPLGRGRGVPARGQLRGDLARMR